LFFPYSQEKSICGTLIIDKGKHILAAERVLDEKYDYSIIGFYSIWRYIL
jgi:hypothetical protein